MTRYDFSMSDVAIQVEHLSKEYKIGSRQSFKTFRDNLSEAMHAPLRRLSSVVRWPSLGGSQARTVDDRYIWALKDISFKVRRGEVLGIIGPNGAGKTTLLRILSRITEPTEGRAEIHGRVGSLLEVGTGFHPELSGRENVYLNGAILGMKKAEIDRKFCEIVEFSGVEKFIDTPVKRYSSGMYVRLAFAVAAYLDPEILLVDEVLAVGDVTFQKKCLGKMGEVAAVGRTVLLISHNMGAIKSLATTVLWLNDGRVREIGESRAVVDNYLAVPQVGSHNGFYDSAYIDSNRVRAQKYAGRIKLKSVTVKDDNNKISGIHPEGSDIFLEIVFSSHTHVRVLEIFVRVKTLEGQRIFTCLPGKMYTEISPGTYRAVIRLNLTPLLPGVYQGDVVLLSHIPEDNVSPAFQFEILPDPSLVDDYRTVLFPSASSIPESEYRVLGLIRVRASWEDFCTVGGADETSR